MKLDEVTEVLKIMKEFGKYAEWEANRDDECEYSWADGVFAMAKAIAISRGTVKG